jgi:hypothetical protein
MLSAKLDYGGNLFREGNRLFREISPRPLDDKGNLFYLLVNGGRAKVFAVQPAGSRREWYLPKATKYNL